jgi:hypothetical protein
LNDVYLVDERTGHVPCRLFPQDKAANASGLRRPLQLIAKSPISDQLLLTLHSEGAAGTGSSYCAITLERILPRRRCKYVGLTIHVTGPEATARRTRSEKARAAGLGRRAS